MSKVFCALAVSVDGHITGRDPAPGRGLGDGGRLFGWYSDGDVSSRVVDSFTLSEHSAGFFDAVARRVGASIAGRTAYEDSNRFGDDGTRHPTAPLSDRPSARRHPPPVHGAPMILAIGELGMIAAHTPRSLVDLGHGKVVTALRRTEIHSFRLPALPCLR